MNVAPAGVIPMNIVEAGTYRPLRVAEIDASELSSLGTRLSPIRLSPMGARWTLFDSTPKATGMLAALSGEPSAVAQPSTHSCGAGGMRR
jgi:hypothetical protein